jgi:hypothetical protein
VFLQASERSVVTLLRLTWLLRLTLFMKEVGPGEGLFGPALDLAHTYGWRMRSEALALHRRHLDLEADTLRLDPGTTKNEGGSGAEVAPGGAGGPGSGSRKEARPHHPRSLPALARRPQGGLVAGLAPPAIHSQQARLGMSHADAAEGPT